jgi:hypothetical protein
MELPPNKEPDPPIGREIYFTPESISIAALVDAMDLRILKRWRTPGKEEEK